jgi:isochorismate synthase
MKREGLVFYPFNRNNKAYFFSNKASETKALEFDFTPNAVLQKEEYQTSVFLAKEEIKEGNLDKVVLARNKILKGKYSALATFENALAKYPKSHVYYINLNGEIWVGASPELLLHFEDGVITTSALAGTKLVGEEFTEKEMDEQSMVEEFIEEKLIHLGLEDFVKSEKQEEVYNEIKHLRTDYTIEATDDQALDLLKHLQPTSAVCGLPRDKSFAFIQDYETLNRSFYAGVTGVMTKTSATFFVNLRCIRFYQKTVELFAGAGITLESDADAEWEETDRKIQQVESLLAE